MTAPCSNSGFAKLKSGLSLLAIIGSLQTIVSVVVDAAPATSLSSPDGRISVSFQMPAPGTIERPLWSATFRGKPILAGCALGLQTADAGDWMAGVSVLHETRRSVNDRIPVLFKRTNHAQDRFHELRYTMETPQHRRADVVFRCYDDAIAFRYELPVQGMPSSITITDETTSFRFEGEPTAFVQYLENFTTSHEHNVDAVSYRKIRPGALLDLPLTMSWPDNTCVAVTEASLRHYAGMSLMRPSGEQARNDLVCRLTPRPDGTKVVRPLPMKTP